MPRYSCVTHADRIMQLREVERFTTLVGVDQRLGIPKMLRYRDELKDVIELLQGKLDMIDAKIITSGLNQEK